MEKTVKSGAALAAPRTLLTWLLVLIILLGVVTPALAADIQQIDLPAIFASGEKVHAHLSHPSFGKMRITKASFKKAMTSTF